MHNKTHYARKLRKAYPTMYDFVILNLNLINKYNTVIELILNVIQW